MDIARLEHISLSFSEAKKSALDDISLQLRAGERCCILGANGSGKSSLAAILAAILLPTKGDVELFGERVCKDGVPDLLAHQAIRGKIGYVFQQAQDQFVTTVAKDDIAFGPENLALDAALIEKRVESAAKASSIDFSLSKDPGELSGGQAARLAAAGALAIEPKLLILDETTAELDPKSRKNMLDMMSDLEAKGYTIVYITHHMDEAMLADRVLVLNQGKLAFDGLPQELFTQLDLLVAAHLELPAALELAQFTHISFSSTDALLQTIADELLEKELIAPTIHDSKGAASEAVIEARHLSFSYTDSEMPTLCDLSFSVHKGEYVALTGHTGSGKSTLAKLLTGLLRPSSGELCVLGKSSTNKRAWKQLLGQVAYVMQRPEEQLFAESVLDDVRFGPLQVGYSLDEATALAKEYLTKLSLEHLLDSSPFELSGGEKRLCAIAGILAIQPKLLILDEPTSGLDPKTSAKLIQILLELKKAGTTIIHITHQMDLAAMADTVYVIHEGNIALCGSAQEVFCEDTCPLLDILGLTLPHASDFALQLKSLGLTWKDNRLPQEMDQLKQALSPYIKGVASGC